MAAHGIFEGDVGFPSSQTKRDTPETSIFQAIPPESSSSASGEQKQPLHSAREGHHDDEKDHIHDDEKDNMHDDEKYHQSHEKTQHGSSTARGYTKVADDQPVPESRPYEGAGMEIGGSTYISRHRRGFMYHMRAWLKEVSCCALAVGLFVALIGLLARHDHKPGPTWLNTVVAVIATLCRALTVVPISEGISQLKWNSFARKQRPLTDLYAFDQAGRGPLGSLKLLFKTRGRLLGVSTLAAVILVSGLATSSLTQATISIEPSPARILQNATAKRAIDPKADVIARAEGMQNAAYSKVMMVEDDRRSRLHQQLKPKCPTGDCHWNPFSSLGVCSMTRNISDELEIRGRSLSEAKRIIQAVDGEDLTVFSEDQAEFFLITLGPQAEYLLRVYDGNWLPYQDPYLAFDENPDGENGTSMKTGLGNISKIFITSHDLIYKTIFQAGIESYRPHTPYRALQLAWYWCIQRYNVSVSGGIPHTRILEETVSIADIEGNKLTLTDEENREEFMFHTPRIQMTGFAWNWTDRRGNNIFAFETQQKFSPSDYDDPDWEEVLWERIDELGDDIALAMSNFLRSVEKDDKGAVLGSASIGLIVVVRWKWLSLFGAQVAFTLISLIYVVIDTARTGIDIVKSSIIAELTAVTNSNADSDKGLLPGGITAKVNRRLEGKLVKEDERWRLDIHRRKHSRGFRELLGKLFPVRYYRKPEAI